MKVQIISTSCNRRELELEQLKKVFEINGYSVSKEDFETDKDADYILLSTCGFTQAAEDFALKTLERINQEKKRECEVIIGGCLPKIHGEVLKGYRLFDPRNYEILDEYFMFVYKFNSIKRPNTIGQWQMHSAYREHGLMSSDKNKIDDVGKKTVKENIDSVLKIGEIIRESKDTSFRIQCLLGCACKCTYCAIKFAIGGIKSRTIEEILEDFDVGISRGYKNILLEGDSLGGYGMDIGTNLGELLECVYKKIEDKEVQISIPDVSPAYLSICCDQIIFMANKKKLFNFYTPIQSGSQKILMAMKRGYDIDKVVDLVLKIKMACPELKIGTSIIVGFPGETLEDFERTLEVCRKIKFDYIYCHSYSERKGTEAFYLDNKIDGEEILRRSRVLKQELKQYTPYITIAEDTAGNRTCQG